jgi:hypothetical protein
MLPAYIILLYNHIRKEDSNILLDSKIVLHIVSRRGPHKTHRSSLLHPAVAVEAFLFAKPLLSNGYCIFVNLWAIT